MDPVTAIVLGLLGVAVPGAVVTGIVAAVRQARREKRARVELIARQMAFSAKLGMDFEPLGPHELFTRFLQLSPFGIGGVRTASNVLTGAWHDRLAQGFCYSFVVTTYNGTSSRTTMHEWCVATVALPVSLPPLQLRRRYGRLREAVVPMVTDDILLESEDFNRGFHLSGPDRRFASAFMHPRMMRRMLEDDTAVMLRVDGDRLLTAMSGVPTPEMLRWCWDYLTEIADLIPSFVYETFGQVPDQLR